MNKEIKYPNKAEMLLLIANSKFRPFEQSDWWAFAGCESEFPLICESEQYCIVIDGSNVNMVYYADEYGGESYNLSEGY